MDHPILSLVTSITCQSRDHLQRYFVESCQEQPIERRAEGVVLRDPSAWYYKENSFFTKKVSHSLYAIFTLAVSIRSPILSCAIA
jgi:hypothetical protein